MTTIEFTELDKDTEAAAAEAIASEVRANLKDYIDGGRPKFEAHFPVGIGSRIQDIAHETFLESLGQVTPEDGYLVLPGGHRLFICEYRFPRSEGGKPYHLIYSSEPYPIVSAAV